MEEDKESELLSRVAANHLVLAQFEPFRAILRSLRGRNPTKALAILQSIITCGGKLDSVIWAPHSCPSPTLLTFLSTVELLQYEDPVSGLWSFNENSLKLRAEFLLYVQMICNKMLERVKRGIEVTGLDNKKMGSVNFDSPVEFLIENEEFLGSCGEYKEVMRVLGLIYSVGLSRLRPNLIVMEGKVVGEGSQVLHMQEEEMTCLKGIILENPEIFDALCRNIELQIGFGENDLSKINMKNMVEEEVLKMMQSCVQTAHLDGMKECLGKSDLDGAISHLKFLHLDYGVEDVEYRVVLGGLLGVIFPGKIDYGSTWFAMREKLLWAYVEMLSSGCTRLVQMIQSIQDELLAAEIEKFKASECDRTHIPLHHLQNFVADFNHETTSGDKESYLRIGTACCRIEMFHYARVGGLHILECVMNTALTAVKAEQFQEANSVLQLLPRLQPLVAVMGWDMLTGKTGLRRKLLQLLWTSKSQVLRMEESQLYHNKPDEVSSVEHLCDLLCYQLDLASFVACVNSGNSWSSKSSLSLSSKESREFGSEAQWDPFVENYVLERLSIQSPLRVLFDVVPSIKFDDAVKLISMQPIDSALAAWKRMQDVELIHMRYALESAMYALGSMERCATATEKDREMTLWHLKDLKSHLDAIHSNPRKILMVNIVISLVHMDDLSLNLTPYATPIRSSGSFDVSWWEGADVSVSDGGIKMCAFFAGKLVDILKLNLPSSLSDADHSSDFCVSAGGKQPLEWRISKAKLFIDDWEWRLFMLHILLPSTERQWKWREALSVLCAAPSKLLNLCMQKAKYDVGEQVVNRYSLSSEDKAALELAQWMNTGYMKATVEDSATYAGERTAVQELDFSSLCSQLGPLAAILLYIDTISSSTKSKSMAMKLLNQAQMMLSEIHPGEPPEHGLTYWEQIHETTMISIANHVLRRLVELMQQDKYPPFQAVLSGEMILLPPKEFQGQGQGQGHGERAVGLLHQMIEDAHRGKRQFLSGKLHNLARAVADEDHARDLMKVEGQHPDRNQILNCIPEVVIGLGLRTLKQLPSVSTGEDDAHSHSNDVKDAEKLLFGPMVSKPTTYLSQFILHIAAIGDIVDGSDTTHDFNYFSVIYEWPKDLITRLDFKQGSADIAGKVAEIRCADFVHEVIAACVPPVYPPRFAHSWACSPVVPAFSRSSSQIKLLSPSSREVAPGSYSHSSGTPGVPLYPLQLDMLKHLVELSPVRAVLACVFGSSILYHGCNLVAPNCLNDNALHEPDTDRLFYEFALDHSERFPALNNWIKMQTKFHVSGLAGVSYLTDGTNMDKSKSASSKRYRDKDSDIGSEVDDVLLGENVTATFLECKDQSLVASDPSHHSPKSESSVPDDIVFLSFDWESQAPYERAVERLIAEGKLMDALILSDRFLHDGASDQLLQLLIERGEQNICTSDDTSGYSGCRIGSNSWQYCIRMKDKHLAAELALRHLSEWNLDAALDVLTMCNCHLPDNDSLKYEVVEMMKTLLRYNRILSADDRCSSWQEVEALCKDDPEGLALRLAEKGAVSPALEVAESAGLSSELRRELKGRRLVKILTADPLSGGGPAAASRFLSSLQDTNDALPVAMGAMQLLPTLRSKQLLVHLLLKRKDLISVESEISLLNLWALGLKVLTLLPLPWQHRCSSLHGNPHLILEVLLMRKQLQYASQILKEFPLLRDNSLILSYAAKAIANSLSSPSRESKILTSGLRAKQKTKTGVPDQPSFSNSPSGSPKEGRRAFSWTPRHTGDKTTPRDTHRKRKGTGLTHSEKVSWEGMTSIREERISLNPIDGQERPSSASIAEDWMLTGDPNKDESVRFSHRYESAPDITLFKALLSLCSDDTVSGKGALDLCCTQMKNVLSSRQLPVNASVETIGLAYHATETFVQGLVFAKSQLRKVSGGSDLSSSNSEKGKDTDDAFSDAGSSSVGSQSTDELSDVIAHADIWLGRAELLQSLLGSGISASLDEIADKESSGRLRDRLIKDERYSMAVYTCKKCKIDVFPVWNAWGHALIRMERYAQARVKFKQALQLYKGDPAPVVLEIINSIEGGPPVDFSSLRSMYDHLARSAPTILDDSLSADSYLNVLHMPSTFPRSERSRRSHVAANDSTIPIMDLEDGSRRNLDTIRYLECVYYLQEYCRQHLLGFMFKHGHYKDACLLFFPPNSVPLPPQPSSVNAVASSTSPQRPDPLAIDYGTIDDLCELCITYGAMSVLEEVISTRVSVSQDPSVNQYNAAALARICRFCESHKHFNFLYDFQVVKKDYVSAGLCCIQLFMNSSSLEEAIRHLEHAKMHFDEGLSTRYKAGSDSTKLVTKGMRGKGGSEKLSEGLVKFSARLPIQIDVVKCFNTEGSQWKYSLFGNPNDPETFKRRCEIAEALAEKSFDLAFQVIYEFHLPAVDIYAGVAASLAERKKGGQLTEFFKSIKGTIDDVDWDQVLGAAINVYANKHKERPDRLIDMLISSHRKVLACVVCGRLKSAFQIASKSGSVADVQYVAHQALHANALPVLDMCKQWLAQYM